MAEQKAVEAPKPSFKRLPLTPEGKLIKNMFNLKSPRRMVIVKYPKSGGTLALCDVPKIVIGDAEEGTDYFEPSNYVDFKDRSVEGQFISTKKYGWIPKVIFECVDELNTANRMSRYWELYTDLKAERDLKIKEKKYHDLIAFINEMPFPILAVDTLTSILKLSNQAALYEYNLGVKESSQREDIHKVDEYSGAKYVRQKFDEVKTFIEQNAAPFIQYHGHVASRKKVMKKNEEDINALDIALEGTMSTILTANADAVATLYRDKEGCWLDFSKKDETDLGSRPGHLGGKKIKIAELLTDEQLLNKVRPKSYWAAIYPEIKF
jgi:hypothetical protein